MKTFAIVLSAMMLTSCVLAQTTNDVTTQTGTTTTQALNRTDALDIFRRRCFPSNWPCFTRIRFLGDERCCSGQCRGNRCA